MLAFSLLYLPLLLLLSGYKLFINDLNRQFPRPKTFKFLNIFCSSGARVADMGRVETVPDSDPTPEKKKEYGSDRPEQPDPDSIL